MSNLTLLYELTQSILTSESFEGAVRVALCKLCRATGWAYGEAWVPSDDGAALRQLASCFQDASLQTFDQTTQRVAFARGEGLPGRVWAARQPEWIRDVSAADRETFARVEPAARHGLHAGFGVPIAADGEVLAVLTFFLWEARPQDDETIKLVTTVAAELGLWFKHKQSQQALERSELRYRTLVEQASDGVFTFDAAGNYLEVNARACELTGYTRGELEAMNVQALILPEEGEFNPPSLRELNEGQSLVRERHIRCKDGQRLPVEISARMLADGRLLALVRDVSERKRAEAETKRHLAQLKRINAFGWELAQLPEAEAIQRRTGEIVTELFPDADAVFVSQFDPDEGVLRCAYLRHEGEEQDVSRFAPIPLEPPGQGMQSEVVHTGRPLIVNDYQDRMRALRSKPTTKEEGAPVRSAIYAPMLAYDRVVGVVQAQSTTPDRFGERDAELLSLAANAAATALENARLYQETRTQLERMNALREIDLTITASFNSSLTFEVVLQQLERLFGVEASRVLLFDATANELTYAAGRGLPDAEKAHRRVRLGEGAAGRAALAREPVWFDDPSAVEDLAPWVEAGGYAAYGAFPLLAKGELQGALEVCGRRPLGEHASFLEALAGQLAIAVDNARLFENLERSNTQLALAYDRTLEGWVKALEHKDAESSGHTRRVTELTLALARELGVDERDWPHLRRGAALHDVGKLAVPDAILLKPGPLTDDEWAVMKQHPVYASEWFASVPYLRPALEVVRSHHERWDGTGYPDGLVGGDIPYAARLFAVVNVWDALLSDRPYRKAWSEDEAKAHLKREAGRQFDPEIVEAFLALIEAGEADIR